MRKIILFFIFKSIAFAGFSQIDEFNLLGYTLSQCRNKLEATNYKMTRINSTTYSSTLEHNGISYYTELSFSSKSERVVRSATIITVNNVNVKVPTTFEKFVDMAKANNFEFDRTYKINQFPVANAYVRGEENLCLGYNSKQIAILFFY